MKIVTHNAKFHTDDLLAVAALLIKYPNAEIIRSRDEKIIEHADIVVDVGQVYDPEKNRFDHHQKSGAGSRANTIPYASLGLVWLKFGYDIAGGRDEAELLEEKLVISVDAIDNGVDIVTPIFDGIKAYSIGNYFESFANEAETLEEFDRVFFDALPLAIELLKREIVSVKHTILSWKEVKEIYNKSEDKSIIALPKGLSWERALISTEAMFVVYPRVEEGHWGVQAVPKFSHSFENKKSFPDSWVGLRGDDLASVSEVEDAIFCHKSGFMCVAKSKEGAIKLAKKALES